MPPEQLIKTVHDYTKDVITQLKTAGGEPDMVQIGNEITPGMLLNAMPGGRGGGGARTVSTQLEGSTGNWDLLASLLKAGIAGTKEADPRILIVLHIDKGGDNAASRSWVDAALAHGVSFDILGESCYTRYQGPPAGWKANFDDLAASYPNSPSSWRKSLMKQPSQMKSCTTCPITAAWARLYGSRPKVATGSNCLTTPAQSSPKRWRSMTRW